MTLAKKIVLLLMAAGMLLAVFPRKRSGADPRR